MVRRLETDSPQGKSKENDHDQDRKRQARPRLQHRRLPLQSLHLPELRLLKRAGRAGDGAARDQQASESAATSAAVQLCCQTGVLSPVS
jgi:hypothetical protein